VEGGWFGFTEDIAELAFQFKALERLSLVDIGLPGDYLDITFVSTSGGALLRLRSLTLCENRFHMEPFLNYLISLRTIPRLHTLCISSISFSEYNAAGQFIYAH
jgi:hypothetical protein